MPFRTLRFLGAAASDEKAVAAMIGLPYDGTASYRTGSRFAPNAIRAASDSIETYDPNLDLDMEDHLYADLGDVDLEERDPELALEAMRASLGALRSDLRLLGFGGEHTVTLPLMEHALERYPDLGFVVFDAHADLRDAYEGTPYSHACVTRRVTDMVGPERVAMFGVRSGLRTEFDFMRKHNLLLPATLEGMRTALQRMGDRPLYVSVDLDGFDPSEIPGTGTVEPGGFFWREFEPLIRVLSGRTVVGADVVELAPDLDPTGRSDVYAARVARALLLLMMNGLPK